MNNVLLKTKVVLLGYLFNPIIPLVVIIFGTAVMIGVYAHDNKEEVEIVETTD